MKTCREVHRLVAAGYDRELGWGERVQIRLHLAICDACRRFDRQMRLLHAAMRRFPGI